MTLDLAEEVLDHVLPVAEHVHDDAAVILLAVIPRGTLELLVFAGEDPVTELAADGEDPAEETGIDEVLQLHEAGQPELVLHHAVLEPGGGDLLGQRERLGGRGRGGLLAVDVFARRDRLAHADRPLARERRVEIDLVGGVRQLGVEVGRDARHARAGGQRPEFLLAAADQHRVGHDHLGVRELHAALIDDRLDRADQVLVGAHASRDAVHDDAEPVDFHDERKEAKGIGKLNETVKMAFGLGPVTTTDGRG